MRFGVVTIAMLAVFAVACGGPLGEYQYTSPINRASTLSTLSGPGTKYPDRVEPKPSARSKGHKTKSSKGEGRSSPARNFALGAGVGIVVATVAVTALGILLVKSWADSAAESCVLRPFAPDCADFNEPR